MNCPENPGLFESKRAVAELVGMREGAIAAAGDAVLVRTDFARLGCSGLDALRQLLVSPTGLPIVVTFASTEARGAASFPEASTVVRKPASADEFRNAVRSMRNVCDQMYLSIGV